MTTRPSPAFACCHRRSTNSSSSSRPTNRVASERSASKRLAASLSPMTRQACCGSENPASRPRTPGLPVRTSVPIWFRVLSAMTTVSGAARPAGGPRGSASRRRRSAAVRRPRRSARRPRRDRSRCRSEWPGVRRASGVLTDLGDHGERGPHRALGVRLVRVRPAEIDQHAIADVARDEAAEARDRGSDARLIGADDGAQIFGIQPGRQCGRTRDVAEHDAELAIVRLPDQHDPRRRRLLARPSAREPAIAAPARDAVIASDGRATNTPIPQVDAEVLEVVRRRAGQQVDGDGILAECRRMLLKTATARPVCDVHRRSPEKFVTQWRLCCPANDATEPALPGPGRADFDRLQVWARQRRAWRAGVRTVERRLWW